MKIALSSGEHPPLVTYILEKLEKQGHQIQYFGPEPGGERDWPDVTLDAVTCVKKGQEEQGIVMCRTGTGACLAANKVPGIRAALCTDAETARGARTWNHANVVALSLRLTSPPPGG